MLDAGHERVGDRRLRRSPCDQGGRTLGCTEDMRLVMGHDRSRQHMQSLSNGISGNSNAYEVFVRVRVWLKELVGVLDKVPFQIRCIRRANPRET